MTTELTTTNSATIAERVMILGDLAQLSPAERVEYYGAVCKSLGLNPLTKPFDYITLNNKLTLYAKKDATDQLRKINGVSIGKPDIQQIDDLIIVTVIATDATGRTDSDIGVVKRTDMRGDVANAMMKAITKAKRRVTLSICGLGLPDESEIDSIPDAKPVIVNDSGVIEQPARVSKPPQIVDVTSQYVKQSPPASEPLGDVAKQRAALVQELNDLNAQLATAGKLDALKETKVGNDGFDLLREKINKARTALQTQ